MAQFDYYEQRDGPGYWLDCQTEYMEHYETRFVVPLVPGKLGPVAAGQLNPIFDIMGEPHAMLTQYAGVVAASELRQPVGSLVSHRHVITNALDFLITGV